MIRHSVTQDFLATDATPFYLVSGAAATPHSALISGYAAINGGGGDVNHGTTSNHPMAVYVVALPILVLLVVSVVALLLSWKTRQEVVALRRVRDKYRRFVGDFPLPAELKAHPPLH